MKDFTYYDLGKQSLHIDSCEWLEETGLKRNTMDFRCSMDF